MVLALEVSISSFLQEFDSPDPTQLAAVVTAPAGDTFSRTTLVIGQ